MKTLKVLFIYGLLFVMSLSSCNEATIDLDPIGNTEASFFQNEAQMTEAVFGTYAKLSYFYKRGGSGGDNLQSIWLLPSDDLTTPGETSTEIFSTLQGTDGKLSRYFNFSYQIISRANIVMEKIIQNGSFAYDAASNADDHHRGEALFLRSLMYFNLWNIYGTAPLVTKRITSLDDAFPGNSTGTQLLDQAIIDLTEAVTLLPAAWNVQNLGRANKNSARGLLSKCLVFRGTVNNTNADFTAAIATVNAMTGMALAPNFNDNFDGLKENNVESLFEFQANRSIANTNPWVGGNDDFAVIGELNGFWGFFNNQGTDGGNNTFRATSSIKNAFEVGDPRIDFSFNMAVDAANGHNVRKYVLNNVTTPDNPWLGLSQNNPRILRYADVLLLKAEAIVRSGGNLSEAIGLVNDIRTRARASKVGATVPANLAIPGTSAQALDLIFRERRLELAFEEGHRWYDLRRRHLAGEINLTTLNFGALRADFNFREFNIYFPLPEAEVLQSLNLNQNAGY